jgi:F-type H+-transporting ATPase subunit alpha
VEILKQPQYQPMAVENQVAAIYAVTNGFIDDVDVEKVRQWELGFHDYLSTHTADVLDGIRTEAQLTDDVKARLEEAIKAWNEAFAAELAGASA